MTDERQTSGRQDRVALEQLTPSERTVAELVCEGLSNPEIAQRLSLSRRTVQSHLRRVYSKLKVTTRLQLVIFWKEKIEDKP